MMRNKYFVTFLILIGVVFGSLVAYLTKDISFLSWLSFGLTFGLSQPLVLDLGVFSLTFAATIDLSIAVILCIILTLLLGKALFR